MASKAERKQKSQASPVEFCRRSLAESNVWDFPADMLKIMKLRGVDSDDIKEIHEIVQHLFTNIVKPARGKCWNRILYHLSSRTSKRERQAPSRTLQNQFDQDYRLDPRRV